MGCRAKPFVYHNGSFVALGRCIHILFGWSAFVGLINRHYAVDENGACVTFIIYECMRHFFFSSFNFFPFLSKAPRGYK